MRPFQQLILHLTFLLKVPERLPYVDHFQTKVKNDRSFLDVVYIYKFKNNLSIF